MYDNDILKEEANIEFKKRLVKFLKDSSGISDIKLTIKSINKQGKGYIVHLESEPNFQTNIFQRESHMDVFALVEQKLARSLRQTDNDRYIIKNYKKLMFLKSQAIRFVTGDMIYSYDVKLKQGGDNSYGNYILETKDIKHL